MARITVKTRLLWMHDLRAQVHLLQTVIVQGELSGAVLSSAAHNCR